MYTAYVVADESRNRLKAIYPPKFHEFIGHHVTEDFGVDETFPMPKMPETIRVVGYACSTKVEAFLVEVNGTTIRPGDRMKPAFYHLTWSIDREGGAKPVDSNYIMDMAVAVPAFDLFVTPGKMK